MVDYAVTVAVDGAGVSSEQLNYLTLQSNLVENSYREIKDPPTMVYAISEIKNIFTEPHPIDEMESGKTATRCVNLVTCLSVAV